MRFWPGASWHFARASPSGAFMEGMVYLMPLAIPFESVPWQVRYSRGASWHIKRSTLFTGFHATQGSTLFTGFHGSRGRAACHEASRLGPVLAGTFKGRVPCFEHPRPPGLVPAGGISFLELAKLDRKILIFNVVSSFFTHSAIQGTKRQSSCGFKELLRVRTAGDTWDRTIESSFWYLLSDLVAALGLTAALV